MKTNRRNIRVQVVSLLAGAIGVALAIGWPMIGGAQAGDIKADYDRASSLGQRAPIAKVSDLADAPVWIENTQKFWYRKSAKGGGNQFVLVDPAVRSKAAAFDHAKLATALAAASGGTYTATSLPFTTFTFVDTMQAIEFTTGGGGGGGGRQGGGNAANQPIQLSFDGSEGNAYSLGGRGGGGGAGAGGGGGANQQGTVSNTLPWSPDSQKLATFRTRPGYNRLVTYV